MDLASSGPFWLRHNGPLHAFAPLGDDVQCEVAIIGAGVTGALVAYQLTRAGVGVAVFDKRPVGQGSTAASTALLLYELDTLLIDLAQIHSPEIAASAYWQCLRAIDKAEALVAGLSDDCGFRRRPSCYLAVQERDVEALQREYDARRQVGIRLEYLKPQAIGERFPFRRPAALWSSDAAEVDAFRLTHRLLERAERGGARIFTPAAIDRYQATPDGVELFAATGQRITARRLVLATGYETEPYLPPDIVDLQSTYAVATRPLPPDCLWAERCLIWEHSRPYLYLRTTEDHRILIGGEDDPFRDPQRRDDVLPQKAARLMQRLAGMFPDLQLAADGAWAGTFGQTRDGLPYIGSTASFPHAYFALGYGGNGITFSILAAEIIRDLFLGRPHPEGELFGFGRLPT